MSEFFVRKTQEQFLKELKEVNPNIEALEEYVNNKTKIAFRCLVCGHVWKTQPLSILGKKRTGCPICAHKAIIDKERKTKETFVRELSSINPNIKVIGDYISSKTPIKCECNICKYTWSASPNNLLRGHGCPQCGNVKRKNTAEFAKELSLIADNITMIGEYKGNKTPILCRCKKCGYMWYAKPNNLLCGNTNCPVCNFSKGERRIGNYLKKLNIEYRTQYTFDGLVGISGKPLRYDFFLPELNILIEYQGGFHDGCATGTYAQTDKEKLIRMEYDKRKRNYAMQHNITLIEIWYYDFDNIEEIIDQRIRTKCK